MSKDKKGRPTQASSKGHDPSRPVGRGNPPVSGQFKTGQSGNPRGRPKRAKTFNNIIDAALQAKVTISENGRARKVSALEAIVLKQRNAALGGDPKACERIFRLVRTQSQSSASEGAPTGPSYDPNEDRKITAEFRRWIEECKSEELQLRDEDGDGGPS